jgi:ectoine hydroxylase-related dioxygenase (phytanoyl-CoA dioxygenase family)
MVAATPLVAYPDPRSPDFQYLQPTFAPGDTAGQLRALHEDGFALIPGLLSAGQIAATRAEIDHLRAFGFDRDTPGQFSHFKCIFNRSPFWLPYLDWPAVGELAEASMGDECHIIGMTAWRSYPGHGGTVEGPGGIHSDQLFWEVDEELLVSGRVKLPIMLCTAHFYLNDITIDLCPTWAIRGSHLSGRSPAGLPPEQQRTWRGNTIQPVLVRAGDVLFFRAEVWHSGSANRSAATRYLLQVHYGHRFMAQKFSPYLNFQFNAEVLAQATPRQRRMLGEHRQSNYD